uniref:Uncharacterized protein n=1 Tax=Anguilla anguilla TaxID=7936 RepID=A0A0E9UMP6_ANGAN
MSCSGHKQCKRPQTPARPPPSGATRTSS